MKQSPKRQANPAGPDRSATDRDGTRGDRPARSRRRADTRGASPYAESLLERCASNPRLKAFNAAIGTAGLEALLGGAGPLTIFAPTNRAFERLSDTQRTALLNDSRHLADVLRHHVVSGRVKAPRATAPRKVTPEFGDDLELTASEQGFRVDQARIVKTNIRATNGVIHAIDRVLDPDELRYSTPILTKGL